jgi:hypothetical protein
LRRKAFFGRISLDVLHPAADLGRRIEENVVAYVQCHSGLWAGGGL